jgi:hypothetical protein
VRPDVAPVSHGNNFSLRTVFWIVLVLILIIAIAECSDNNGGYYGTAGGAYGGYSTGGGHK